MSPEDRHTGAGRRLARGLAIVTGVGSLLALAAAAALLANPVTGPELRSYLRDRFLRPHARLPGA